MSGKCVLALIFAALVVRALESHAPLPIEFAVEPDTSRSRPLGHKPIAEDLDRLKSVQGRRREGVLLVLGHPKAVIRSIHGEEVWHYDWPGTMTCVWIENGRCTHAMHLYAW